MRVSTLIDSKGGEGGMGVEGARRGGGECVCIVHQSNSNSVCFATTHPNRHTHALHRFSSRVCTHTQRVPGNTYRWPLRLHCQHFRRDREPRFLIQLDAVIVEREEPVALRPVPTWHMAHGVKPIRIHVSIVEIGVLPNRG